MKLFNRAKVFMLIIAIAVVLTLLPQGLFAQAVVEAIPDFPEGNFTKVEGISADGQTLVGNASIDSTRFTRHAFIWTRSGGLVDLGGYPGADTVSFAVDASANGNTVAGYAKNTDNRDMTFSWTVASGLVPIGFLPGGTSSKAIGISDDGTAIAGNGSGSRGFFWTATNGMTDIGNLDPDNDFASVYGISGDGNTVVGFSRDADNRPRAFAWTPGGGMVNLGVLPGYDASIARDASTDGSVLVGSATLNDPNGQIIQACRWVNGVIEPLGWLPGPLQRTRAYFVTDNGNTVFGTGIGTDSTSGVFIWTQQDGMRDLESYLSEEQGVNLNGWLLGSLAGISGDGRVLTGFGISPEGRTKSWRIGLDDIRITDVSAPARWVADARDTVRWKGPDTLTYLVSFSDDGGQNWVDLDITNAGDSSYVWQVPNDQSSSNRGLFRIANLADATIFALSDTITVKGYDLFRILPDGTPQTFTADHNGWFFLNDTTFMWPKSWWEQFTYVVADDPYTGERYPSHWFNSPINARSWNFPDWPNWVEAFGEDVCYWSTTLGIYKGEAVNAWWKRKKLWRGSCYGFASSSLLAWSQPEALQNRYPVIAQTDSIYNLFMTNSIRKAINQYYIHQYGQAVLDNDVIGKPKSPRQLLTEVKEMFLAENPDPRVLSYYNNNGSGAHAVVPIRWERDADSTHLSRLYLYNSNNPAFEDDFIFIDSTANTWTDSSGLGYGSGSSRCFLEPPVSTFLVDPVLDELASERILSGTSGYLELSVSEFADAIIRNSLGEAISTVDSLVTENIPGGIAIIPKDGGYSLPIGYYLPDNDYTIELSDLSDSLVYLSADLDSFIYSYDRSTAQFDESERITLSEGLAIRNPNPASRTVRLEVISVGSNRERIVEAAGLLMQAGDSLAIEMSGSEKIFLENFGAAKDYRLALKDLSADGALLFERVDVPLAANSTHTIAPDWQRLASIPVTIYIDNGNDGTIDDSLMVKNQLTGIDDFENGNDGELPGNFVLAENYPNPFNPQTTLRFGMPFASRVTLAVYDILGRRVATLVDGIREAGWHEVVWNGQDERGAMLASGVYLYRFQAGDVARTGKMVLLR